MGKVAIIDMGTNTFHLLIAAINASGHRILHRDYEAVKIGVAGINEGRITEDACLRAIHAMKKFRRAIDRFGASDIRAFGTSAFRNAHNGSALAAEIEAVVNIPIQIISGDQEAGYIFDGIRSAIALGPDPCLVVDIGAGSDEFIIGNHTGILWKQSFEIGGQRLVEKYHKHDPILATEIDALDAFFDEVLAPLMTAVGTYNPAVMIGSSGTFDTLSDIFCFRHNLPHVAGALETPLTREGFFEIYADLIGKNRDERLQIPGMIPMRVDLIVVGCCLVRYLLEKHPFTGIRVSTCSLKEGVLAGLSPARR